MTHQEAIEAAAAWLEQAMTPLCVLINPICGKRGERPDIWAYLPESNSSVMIECKVSLPDLKADMVKPWRRTPGKGVGNYRYLACSFPFNGEMPKHFGLLTITEAGVVEIVEPVNQPANLWHERKLLSLALAKFTKAFTDGRIEQVPGYQSRKGNEQEFLTECYVFVRTWAGGKLKTSDIKNMCGLGPFTSVPKLADALKAYAPSDIVVGDGVPTTFHATGE